MTQPTLAGASWPITDRTLDMEHEGFIKLTSSYPGDEVWVRYRSINGICKNSDVLSQRNATEVHLSGSCMALVRETPEEIFKKIEEAY